MSNLSNPTSQFHYCSEKKQNKTQTSKNTITPPKLKSNLRSLPDADLNIAQTAWGDSGVYVCSVISSQDLSGNGEDYTELIVLGKRRPCLQVAAAVRLFSLPSLFPLPSSRLPPTHYSSGFRANVPREVGLLRPRASVGGCTLGGGLAAGVVKVVGLLGSKN